MTSILGISAFYHDSAAALVIDGDIVAAAQEERFSRKKHDFHFPIHAIEYCLAEAELAPEELDYVGFYDKPLLKFERLLETYLSFAPGGFRSFLQAMPLWLKQKLHLPREMNKGLKGSYRKRYVFTEHHESHAASAFFPSPFDEAAILTLDGVGEWATASYGTGRGNRIELTHELRFPHSLGLLYSAFTYYTGFRVNSGEYKLMGLAPYGEPKYAELILEKLVDLKDDGSFRMDMSYFNYCQGLTMTSRKLHRLLGQSPRKPETPIEPFHMDVAASIQYVTEEIMLRAARHVQRETGMSNLCLAGGVALNCVGNGRILRESPFEKIWIQPAAGDAGGALGVALFIWHQLLENPRVAKPLDSQHGSLLGPRFSEEEIRSFLDEVGAKYRQFDGDDPLCDYVAEQLAQEKVVGWMQGRMEFGPRALGSRSILGDARSEKMQSLMNLKIKFRESFRPFAPSILEERAAEFFEMQPGQSSPYMLLVAPVRESKRIGADGERSRKTCHETTERVPLRGEIGSESSVAGDALRTCDESAAAERSSASSTDVDVHRTCCSPTSGQPPRGLDRLKTKRSSVPAVTHVDYSARVQTVDSDRHGTYYKLLKRFEEKTDCPVVINTSFNIRGEPIVCTPEHAYRCFMATNMDILVLERFVLRKDEQPGAAEHDVDEYLARFQLD